MVEIFYNLVKSFSLYDVPVLCDYSVVVWYFNDLGSYTNRVKGVTLKQQVPVFTQIVRTCGEQFILEASLGGGGLAKTPPSVPHERSFGGTVLKSGEVSSGQNESLSHRWMDRRHPVHLRSRGMKNSSCFGHQRNTRGAALLGIPAFLQQRERTLAPGEGRVEGKACGQDPGLFGMERRLEDPLALRGWGAVHAAQSSGGTAAVCSLLSSAGKGVTRMPSHGGGVLGCSLSVQLSRLFLG